MSEKSYEISTTTKNSLEVAQAILFLADLIAKTAKKDHEAEGVAKNTSDPSMG